MLPMISIGLASYNFRAMSIKFTSREGSTLRSIAICQNGIALGSYEKTASQAERLVAKNRAEIGK